MRIFIFDTDGCGSEPFVEMVNSINQRFRNHFGYCIVTVLSDPSKWGHCPTNTNSNETYDSTDLYYGYEATDLLVDYTTGDPKRCQWLMVTNGDNAYNRATMRALAPSLLDNRRALIAFDFVTHHERNKNQQQLVKHNVQAF